MVRTPIQEIERKLQDLEYAKLFGAAEAKAEFAVTLATLRQSLKMTQKELAGRSGVTQPYIAKLEGGEANPTLGTVGSMLAVVGYRLAMDTKPLLYYSLESTSVPVARQRNFADDTGKPAVDWGWISGAVGAGSSGRLETVAVKVGADASSGHLVPVGGVMS